MGSMGPDHDESDAKLGPCGSLHLELRSTSNVKHRLESIEPY